VGVNRTLDPANRVAGYLESEELPQRVWAAQATLKGGDASYEKFLITLVKDEPRLLTDMGELGDVLADLNLIEAVPYCIARLKHAKAEYRADAAEALGKLTGLNLEYQSMDNDELRRTTIKAYTRWWEEKKKERRQAR
jgi:HEAT repeat protein